MPKPMNVKGKGSKSTVAAKGGGGGGLKSRLAAIKAKWNEKKEESKKSGYGNNFSGPDGKYLFKLTRGEVKEGDKLLLITGYECVAGEYAGDSLEQLYNLEDAERFVWLQRDLRKLNVDVDDLDPENLPSIMKELIDAETHAVCTVKTSGEYQNIRLVRVVDASELDDVMAEYGGAAVAGEGEASEGGSEAEAEASTEGGDAGETQPEPTKPKGWKPAKGMRVVVKFDDTWYGGEINSCPPNAKACMVKFDDGDQQSVPVDALFPEPAAAEGEGEADAGAEAESGGDGAEIAVGNNVWWTDGKGEFTGEVKSVNGTTLMVKLDTGKMVKVDSSKLEVSVLA